MTNEVLINRLTNIVDEITRIGGEQERTSITPGISVADATPLDLPTGYIKIVNPRDGTWVPCLTINGLVVEDNDLVNVLFTKGTEPIAVSQSATSPSNTFKVSEVWESDFDAVALQADDDGGIGIGTATTPHGGVGIAKFAIDGAAGSATGPHIQLTTDQDNFPRLGIYPWSDDDIRILFDSYRTGAATFLSSDVGSNFSLEKNSNRLGMFYSQGNAQGASVSFLDGIILNRDGEVGIGEFDPSDKLTIKGLAATDCDVGIYTNDGDGTDSVNLSLYGVGTPGAITNRERLLIQYDDTGPIFRIQSEANGTGTVRDLVIETEGNSNQLFLDAGSNIGIDAGTSPAGKLEINAATTTETGLIVQTTDDDETNPIVAVEVSDDTEILKIDAPVSSTLYRVLTIDTTGIATGERALPVAISYDDDSTNLLGAISSGMFFENTNTTSDNYTSHMFVGKDTNLNSQTFGHIACVMTDHTFGSIDSEFSFIVREAGSLIERLRIKNNGHIGLSVPENLVNGLIRAYDTISGFSLWEYDGLDGTVRTVIQNNVGDVLYRLHTAYVLRDSTGAVASGTTDVSNGASVNLTVGANTVRLRVNAAGSVDVARTAGANTIKVALTNRWL